MTHVVFLHGQPGAGSDFDEVIARLPPGIDPFAPDRPGYRSNPAPACGAADNARWLAGELDRVGVDRAVLVGHSYGGGVALVSAAMFPERLQGLVLVASTGPHCLNRWDHVLAAPVVGPACAFTAFSLLRWAPRAVLAVMARRLGRPLRVDEHVDLATWADARHEHGQVWRTFLTEQRDLVRNDGDLAAAAERVSTPTVILADPDDDVVPVETARALHAALTGSSLQLVEGAGHALPRTEPEVVARAVADLVTAG